jgi:hypothetical protein
LNRALVQLLAAESVTAAEVLDLRRDLVPFRPGPGQLGAPTGSERGYSATSKLTDVPRSAARALAAR